MEPSQTSLPLSRLHQSRPNNWEDRSQTGIEAPDLMGHKVSNSHSSLSSYASWRSISHSRISSATTVSGVHSAGQSLTELPLLETEMAPNSESYQALTSAKRKPQSSGDRMPVYDPNREADAPKRSGSPSDAVLNMKGALKPPPTGTPTSPRGVGRTGPQNEDSVRTTYDGSDNNDNIESDCRDERLIGAGPRPMRTFSSSSVSSAALGYEHHQISKPSMNLTALDEGLDKNSHEKPVCMFVDDCDTGSQLRKAISHLFGRNKTCTLKIPEMVWVYYCRKHYQRVRYRNARTYPVTQMQLVETQIERLKTWSDRNQARGEGAYIDSWTLSLRKREEKRLQGDKKGRQDDKEASKLETGHIPAWLIEKLGSGHDTESIFDVAKSLREQIENGTLAQVPEIEFLPDIVGDDKEKEMTKSTRQRKQNSSISVTKTSKRKAPEFQVLTQSNPTYHDMGYAGYAKDSGYRYDADGVGSPSGKRPRTARAATFLAGPSNSYTTSSYWAGPEGPPRAENVVPKMQPIEYHPYAHSGGNGRFEPTHPSQGGHARVASYSGVLPEPEYSPEPYYQRHNMPGYGQMPGYFSGSQSSPNSPPTLPSLASQMHKTALRYGRHESPLPAARPQARGASRPMHQRSASAFTPGKRYVSMSGRPSSSGNGYTVEHGRYEASRQAPRAAMYDAGHHGPQGYAEVDSHHHHHQTDAKSGWMPDHAHPVAPIANHSQYSHFNGPSYGSPSHAGMHPRNGIPGDAKNGMSTYPEPRGISGIRAA
ncbi:hypothetical protein ED733_004326 [Metarhizium rileyi]|uniref:ORP1 like protein n=1 Tax=Metarhizium rileyi (strain RCEF 4871) TaxID=1649241 RepID=A0A5C6G9A1_METRR|nr:hypothetical protein ED733_004326 [Metarhizium rileyi]